MSALEDGRVAELRPLLPASCVIEGSPYTQEAAATVLAGREAVRSHGHKLLVVVGPCTIHDAESTLEYARRLAEAAKAHAEELVILMRCSYAAPDSSEWRGLVMDPELDGSLKINKGLRAIRSLLLAVNGAGVPVGCEFADAIVPQYIADLVSWGQVGSASRQHRELASGLSMPVGFAASTAAGGTLGDASGAILAAARSHPFIGVSKQGVAGVVHTTGNRDCHATVAGDAHIDAMVAQLTAAGLPPSMVVDCSADADQLGAVKRVAERVAGGSMAVSGVVLKSFLVSGAQPPPVGAGSSPRELVAGMSIAGACLDWSDTLTSLSALADAVKRRRATPDAKPTATSSAAAEPASTLFRESNTQLPTDNLRIRGVQAIVPAACLQEELPHSGHVASLVTATRKGVQQLVRGGAKAKGGASAARMLVVVGPCTLHDVDATLQYAARLADAAKAHAGELLVLLRCAYAAPEASAWTGLVMDPDIDGSLNVNKGLHTARELLQAVNQLGLPVACEFADTTIPQYLADLVSWAQIGSRSAQSKLHRELASGLSMPVGFEAPSAAGGAAAVDAILAAARSHPFIGVSKQGVAGVVHTTGNDDCHAIVEGDAHVDAMVAQLTAAGLPPSMVVDCSADADQLGAVKRVAERVAGGSMAVSGVVLKSFLAAGAQPVPPLDESSAATGLKGLKHGVSITDPCVDWDATRKALDELAAAVKQRRGAKPAAGGDAANGGAAPATKKARRSR